MRPYAPGPTCSMVLGDRGAEVIKIEPLAGDNTRRLLGAGAGFNPLFNRNKKSLAVNLKDPRGRTTVLKLLASADVFSENLKTGSMAALGAAGYRLARLVPGLRLVLGISRPAPKTPQSRQFNPALRR